MLKNKNLNVSLCRPFADDYDVFILKIEHELSITGGEIKNIIDSLFFNCPQPQW